jgi:hypothetical protein
MTWTIYLMLTLLIAACIPLLDVLATWNYLRFAKGIPPIDPTIRRWIADRRGATAPEPAPAPARQIAAVVARPEDLLRGLPNAGTADGTRAVAQRLHALAIGFDGRQYTFAGYRYDRASDAIDYAELMRSRGVLPARGGGT